MSKTYIEEQKFEKVDFTKEKLQKGEYEICTFINCNFSAADLSDISFSECEFIGCNLSNAMLSLTSFKDIKFKQSKLLGLHFENCNPFLFAVNFEDCILNFSSFNKLRLKNTKFKNCTLQEVDFADADLNNAIFENCDLNGAVFENTNLEKSDFRTSYNFSIDPEINKLKKAKFSAQGLAGLLQKYDILIDN